MSDSLPQTGHQRRTVVTTARTAAAGLSSASARSIRAMSSKGRMATEFPA